MLLFGLIFFTNTNRKIFGLTKKGQYEYIFGLTKRVNTKTNIFGLKKKVLKNMNLNIWTGIRKY